MYGQLDQSETQRKKLILVSAVMGLIIIILAVVLVSAIANKNKKEVASETSDAEVALEEGTKDNADVSRAEDSADSNLEPVSNETDGNASNSNSSSSSSSSSNSGSSSNSSAKTSESKLPTTGPSETLSLALLLGSVATFLASAVYRKQLA